MTDKKDDNAHPGTAPAGEKATPPSQGTTTGRPNQLAEDVAKARSQEPIEVVGTAPGPFNINGEGFGTSGQLTIAERTIETTRWDDKVIKGQLPADLKNGAVVLTLASGETRKGVYPTPARPDRLAQPVPVVIVQPGGEGRQGETTPPTTPPKS